MKKGIGSFLGLRAGKSSAHAAGPREDGPTEPPADSRHKRQMSHGHPDVAGARRDSGEVYRGRSASEDAGSIPPGFGAPTVHQGGISRARGAGEGETGATRSAGGGTGAGAPKLTIQSAAAIAASFGLQVEIVGSAGGTTGVGGERGPSGNESWNTSDSWGPAGNRRGDAWAGGAQGGYVEGSYGHLQGGNVYSSYSKSPIPSDSACLSPGPGPGSSYSGLGSSAYQSGRGAREQEAHRPSLHPGAHNPGDLRRTQEQHSAVGSGDISGAPGVQRGEEETPAGGASGEGVPKDPGPPLLDEDWAEPLTWAAVAISSSGAPLSDSVPAVLPGEPDTVSLDRGTSGAPGQAQQFPQDSFRARVSRTEAFENSYGCAEPLACSHLAESTPAIRPSRLGICPGHASSHSTDIHFVPVCGDKRGGSLPADSQTETRPVRDEQGGVSQEQEGGLGSEHEREREGAMPGQQAEWQWEPGDVDGESVSAAIQAAHASFSTDTSLTGTHTCEGLLAALLDVTESTFGFIASNARLPDASPCLKTHAITNVMWTERLRAWYAEHVRDGLVFTHVAEQGLFGRAALRGQAVLDNSPQSEALPRGHPNVTGVAALPLICGPWIVGVAVVANRIGGYEASLLGPLAPLLSTAAAVLFAVAWRAESGRSIRKLLCPILTAGTVRFDRDGRVHSLDAAAQAVFGLAPTHAWLLTESASPPPLFLRDLFWDPSTQGQDALHLLGHEPRTLWGRQQGGQRVYLQAQLTGEEGQGDIHGLCEASVQVLLQ